jgi:hypothetical protein
MFAVAVFASDQRYSRFLAIPSLVEKHMALSTCKNVPAETLKSKAVGAHALIDMEPAGLKRGNGHFAHVEESVSPKYPAGHVVSLYCVHEAGSFTTAEFRACT